MSVTLKTILGSMIAVALAFGFFHHIIPDSAYDFERLHIFFFNLGAGGCILLHFARRMEGKSHILYAWLIFSSAYAIAAFFEAYELTMALSVPLFALAETTRIRRFSFLPLGFFRRGAASDKFLHAALLCLSCGLVISSFVILNNEFLHWFYRPKLTIDVFFLGFSFPLSLLTFSVMFSFMKPAKNRTIAVSEEFSFWSVTLGVIVFFVFIIFEQLIVEIIIASTLLVSVCLIYWLFIRYSKPVQQRYFLISGMAFLLSTGLTGVVYLIEYVFPGLSQFHGYVLTLHATVALYGWNLSGLLIIIRWTDFPITRHVPCIIALHWLAVLVLTPAGKYEATVAIVAIAAYLALLGFVLYGRRRLREAKET